MSFPEAVETLANSMGLEVPRDESDRPARRYDELFDLTSRVERFWQGGLRDNSCCRRLSETARYRRHDG